MMTDRMTKVKAKATKINKTELHGNPLNDFDSNILYTKDTSQLILDFCVIDSNLFFGITKKSAYMVFYHAPKKYTLLLPVIGVPLDHAVFNSTSGLLRGRGGIRPSSSE